MPSTSSSSLGERFDALAIEAITHPIRSLEIGITAVGAYLLVGKGLDVLADRLHDKKEQLHERWATSRAVNAAPETTGMRRQEKV